MKQQRRIEKYLGTALNSYTDLQELYGRKHVLPIAIGGETKGIVVADMRLMLPLENFMEHYVLVECQLQTPESREIKASAEASLGNTGHVVECMDVALQSYEMQMEAYQEETEAWLEANKALLAERRGRLKGAFERMGAARGKDLRDTVKAVEELDELAKWQTRVDVGKLHTVLRTLKQPADLLAKMGIIGGERLQMQIAHAYNPARRFAMDRLNVLHPKGIYNGQLDLESIAHYIHTTATAQNMSF